MIFDRVRGQRRAAQALEGFLKTRNIPSALLFAGPEGVGKTLMAREFAKALLCRAPTQSLMEHGTGGSAPCAVCPDCLAIEKGIHPDAKAVNAAYQASLREEDPGRQKTLRVETIRHLRQDMELQSMLGGWKLAIIENAQTLEIEAANALLKILEEPPPLTLWILAATQRERLPKTIASRCQTVAFVPLSARDIESLLAERGLGPEEATRLAGLCDGSMSRALELAQSPGYPASLTEGALAPFAAADALPRELHLARSQAEIALFALAQDLRLRHLRGEEPFSRVEAPLREIGRLRQALRSNADPRLILSLAAIETQTASRNR